MSGRPVTVALDDVPETLLLPLWGRAQLTREGNRILRDDAAVKIVDSLDYDFTKVRADLDYSKNLCWIARARQLDLEIEAFARRHPGCTVVNLGAGLDTTLSRVDDGRMRWIDVDLPEVVAIRKRLVPERDRSTCIAASLLDYAWMAPVPSSAGVLFVAGGVLFYFVEPVLVDLFREMGRRFPGAEIVFDAFTPRGVTSVNRMLRRVGMEGAMVQWGLTDARSLESWGANLEVIERYDYFRGLDLRGVPLATRLMTIANRILGVMTIVHCRWR